MANDILLINPKIQDAQADWMNKASYGSMTMSLGALAGYLKKYTDAKIKILDEVVETIDPKRLKKELDNLTTPKIVGLSTVTITAARAFAIADQIKKIEPAAKIIIGGIHVTAIPNEALSKKQIDIVVRGEGEATLLDLYQTIKNGQDHENILGISFRKNGQFFHNQRRPLLPAEEIPPFPYELFADFYHLYRDFTCVVSSRGCPYNCSFCSQRIITGQTVRFFPVERVIDDIKLLVDKYQAEYIAFLDDNFCVSKERLYEIVNAIIDSGYHKKTNFNAQLRADAVTSEIIKKLKEANFNQLGLGMESGSNRLLKILNKSQTVEKNIEAIKIAAENGVPMAANLIFGVPTETHQDRVKAAKLLRNLPLGSARINIAIPYPGTKLYEIAKSEGALNVAKDWKNFSVQSYLMNDNIPYVPKGNKKAILIYDTFMANISFYLRWRILKKVLGQRTPIGGAVTLKSNWYFSPKEWWFLIKIGTWIVKHSSIIVFRYWLSFLK